jgi:hypothetical protein
MLLLLAILALARATHISVVWPPVTYVRDFRAGDFFEVSPNLGFSPCPSSSSPLLLREATV